MALVLTIFSSFGMMANAVELEESNVLLNLDEAAAVTDEDIVYIIRDELIVQEHIAAELSQLEQELNQLIYELRLIMPQLPPIDMSKFEVMYRMDEDGSLYSVLTDDTEEYLTAMVNQQIYDSTTPEMRELESRIEENLQEIYVLVNQNFSRQSEIEIAPLYADHAIAMTLNAWDGISVPAVLLEGGIARDRALRDFPYAGQAANLRDAFRHFYWTWRMSNNILLGARGSRIASNNHEWANMIGRRHGGNVINAVQVRSQYLNSINTVAMFNAIFSRDDIMDFWNNRSGATDTTANGNARAIFDARWQNTQMLMRNNNTSALLSPLTLVVSAQDGIGGTCVQRRQQLFNSGWWRNP